MMNESGIGVAIDGTGSSRRGGSRCVSFVKRIGEVLHVIGSLILFFCFFYVFIDVLFRFLKLSPIGDVIELCGYLDVWLGLLGVGFVFREGKHICVDIVTSNVSDGKKYVMSIISDIVMMLFCMFMTYKGIHLVVSSYELGELSMSWGFPIWPFRIVVPLGFFFLLLEVILHFASLLKDNKKRTVLQIK